MSKELPKLCGVSRLIKRAALHQTHALRVENHQSLPIPVSGPEGISVAFLHCATGTDEQGQCLISAPTYVSLWQAETGAFEELRAVSPFEFNLQTREDGWLGPYPSTDQPGIVEDSGGQKRLYECYDSLLAPFAALITDVPLSIRTAAREFRRLFPTLVEKPLLPCYQVIGGRFFGWVIRMG
jgi:hypothetical protein